MPKIFISYRRKDSLLHAGRIFDQLALKFDSKDIFMDFAIPTGGDFPLILQNAVENCDICLVIIGKDWGDILYQRILENADDWVRFEVRLALERHEKKECIVMPILVAGATIPDTKLLPDDIHKLTDLNGLSVRDFQRDFHNDIAQLVADIQTVVGASAYRRYQTPPPSPKIDIFTTFEAFEQARNASQWDEARQYLAQLRAMDSLPLTIASTLDEDEKEVWEAINRQIFHKKRDEEYQILRIRTKGDKKRFRAVYEVFSRAYPDYDPDSFINLASNVHDILPQPFEWVHIPAGKVTIGYGDWERGQYVVKREKDFRIESFTIAKYPITNSQYEVFVKHPTGYVNLKWWDFSDDAKRWRTGRPEMNPSYFDGNDCPRECVSWYDSVAFCLWLSEMTGEKIMLPTEEQWQWAAIGNTNRIYPWGNNIDETYANYKSNLDRTTPVTQYPKGASLYGVMDMSGNVWEWCLNAYETGKTELTGTDIRVLRGGSWNHYDNHLSGFARNSGDPQLRPFNMGFRCFRS